VAENAGIPISCYQRAVLSLLQLCRICWGKTFPYISEIEQRNWRAVSWSKQRLSSYTLLCLCFHRICYHYSFFFHLESINVCS